MPLFRSALLVSLLLALSLPAGAETLLRYDFENGDEGWKTTFPGASLKVTREAGRNGGQGLEFSYTLNATASPAFFVLPTTRPAGAKSVRFWIQCSAPTPMQFALGDRKGGGYYFPFQCPANEWVRVSLPLADLYPTPASTAPASRFDPGELSAIRFQDVSRFHAAPEELGPRTIRLDQLEFLTESAPSRHDTRTFSIGKGITIDNFDTGVLGWEVTSGVAATAEEVAGRQVGRLAYQRGAATGSAAARSPGMLTHIDGGRLLTGMQGLRIVVRSKRDAALQLEFIEYLPDYRSITYQTTVPVPASRDWRVLRVPVEDFRLAPNTVDPSAGFNPERVWMMRVVDAQRGPAADDNVLELDEIAVILARPNG